MTLLPKQVGNRYPTSRLLNFSSYFRKWSNLWSDRFFVWLLKSRMRKKVNVYKGFRAFGKPATENRLHAPKENTLPNLLQHKFCGYRFCKPGSVVGNHLSCLYVTTKLCAASLLNYGRGDRAFLPFAGRCFG